MVEINLVGLSLGVTLTLLAVAMHYARGTGWTPTADISQEVLERRASAVPETDFPEPMNRSIGGGTAPAAVPAGETEEAELEEGDATEETSPADIPDDEYCYFRNRPEAGLDHVCWSCGRKVTGFGEPANE